MTFASHHEAPDAVDRAVEEWAAILPDQDMSSLHVVSRMLRVVRIFEKRREQVLQQFELAAWSFDMLAVLRRNPHGQATPGELMDATLVTSGTMTARLKSLEGHGWVRRTQDRHDRRQMNVSMTKPGQVLFDQVLDGVVKCQREVVDSVDPDEADALRDIFHKMLLRLDDVDSVP